MKKDVKDEFVQGVVESLRETERAIFRGFGVFKVKNRPARTGRNPKTGESVSIPAKTVVVFRSSKDFNERIEREVEAQKNMTETE